MENINNTHLAIKHWNADDRPREKMMLHGPGSLSVAELLAIVINNGTQKTSAIDLARELLRHADNRLGKLARLSLKDLQKVKGIGPAKAVSIKAALQLAIALQSEDFNERKKISSSKDLVGYLKQKLQHETKEVFVVIFLDRSNKILASEVISIGGITGTVADPRIILRRALELGASALVLSHNHPSGNLRPSQADKDLTQKLKAAAKLIDMEVMDHLIISEEGYYSFADDGQL
jgi:DNA repair protein RadC